MFEWFAQQEKKLNDKIIEGKKIAYRHEKVRDQLVSISPLDLLHALRGIPYSP